ncbi:MAG: fumarylacetoacetate hydrolase family protein [Alphaproteobacteria bacterium]|nr:fumarylacetoacetate hydrolase family protein [Alphaproteobacteria bacterium]
MTIVSIDCIAARLFDARRAARAIAPVRGDLPERGIAAAYEVQKINARRKLREGRRIVGRKIGLTSAAVQKQLGVDQPDFGVLFDDMCYRGDEVTVPLGGFIAPRIEAEIAFVLSADIPKPVPAGEIAPFIACIAASAEIVDSAIANWDINIVDTIADNASSGAFALGTELPYQSGTDLCTRAMTLRKDGELVSSGKGAATLGDPLIALSWLAGTAAALGDPLRAGDIILAGALGPMTPFLAATYEIEIEGFPKLTVRGKA